MAQVMTNTPDEDRGLFLVGKGRAALLSCLLVALGALFSLVPSAGASDWSGTFRLWGGAQGTEGQKTERLFRARATWDWKRQWSPSWSSSVGACGAWTTSAAPYEPFSSSDGEENLLDAEWERLGDEGRTLEIYRLQRAQMEFKRGPWQAVLGRAALAWGESRVARPTSVFHARRFLEPFKDEPLGSDGADLSYALGANTNLEVAARALRGGRMEFVARLENRGIGVSGTPLVVNREGAKGGGLEVAAILKHFQCRFEGMAWRIDGVGGQRVEFVAGLESTFRGFPVGAEFLRDGTGGLLGLPLGAGESRSDYVALYLETPSLYRLRFSPRVVRSCRDDLWFVDPELSYALTPRLSLGLDGLYVAGEDQNKVAAPPTRLGLSVTANF